jgi:hypothetical protein
MNAWRVGAMMVVVVMAVVNVVHIAQTVPPPPRESPGAAIDPVTRHERRLAALSANVGARGLKGTIGYIGDLSGSRLAGDARGVEDYYLTQFALVPLVLDSNPEPHEWAVANLRTTIPQTRVPGSWRIVEDFGEGVLLLRKAAR